MASATQARKNGAPVEQLRVKEAARREPLLNAGVSPGMKLIPYALVLAALCWSGCAATPEPAPRPSAPWPESVATTCPQRKIHLECFRNPAIRSAMRALIEEFQACHRPLSETVKVRLSIETRGGSASCVDHAPRDSEIARCVATVVARQLDIPHSPPDERCDFQYPLLFSGALEGEKP